MALPRFTAIPPRRRPRSSTGFRGVRRRASGRYAAEITHDNVHWWMGTFDGAEEAARAYDLAVFSLGLHCRHLNFPATRDLAEAERLAPDSIRFVSMEEEKESRRAECQLRDEQRSQALLDRIRAEEPELVQAEVEFFATKDAAKQTATGPSTAVKPEAGPSTAVKEEAPGPSTVVKIESDSSIGSGWDSTDDDEYNWDD